VARYNSQIRGLQKGAVGVIIRAARRADVPAILAIYNDAVLNTTASADYEPRTLESRLAWFDAHAEAGYPVFVAVKNGKVAGWSALSRYRERVGYRFTVENSIYVDAGERGSGIGRQLMRPLVEAAQAMGMHTILAVISADNEASIRLHRAFGFEEVGRVREVIYKFETWIDVIFMQKMLSR
jgi:phosphinothricin acetyltransferase